MKKTLLVFVVLLTAYASVNAQSGIQAEAEQERLKDLVIGLYNQNPDRDMPEEEMETLMAEHKNYMVQLKEEGKMLMQGPVMENEQGLLVMVIFNSEDIEDVKGFASKDPAVDAGLFVIEFYKWSTKPGECIPLK